MRIKVREKRQVTLPAELLDALGVKPGDSLEVEIKDGSLRLKPSRRAALEALAELRRAFAETGLTEVEWIDGLKDVRAEVYREAYPTSVEEHATRA